MALLGFVLPKGKVEDEGKLINDVVSLGGFVEIDGEDIIIRPKDNTIKNKPNNKYRVLFKIKDYLKKHGLELIATPVKMYT